MKLLKALDLSIFRINFTIEGKVSHKSIVGGILSIQMIIVFIYLFYLFSFDIFQKLNPALLTQKVNNISNETIDLNNNLFNIIIRPYTQINGVLNYTIDQSILTIEVYNRVNYDFKNGTNYYRNERIPIKVCDIKDFNEKFYDFFNTNAFDSENSVGYCLETKDVSLRGLYVSEVFSYLTVLVVGCTGEDFEGNLIQCKNSSTIDELISKWRITTYLTYTQLNFDDYQNFYTGEIFSAGYYLSPAVYTRDDYFISNERLVTDDDWFITGKGRLDILPSFIENKATSATDSSTGSKKNFLNVFLRVNRYYNYSKRIYKKLPEAIAQVISLVKVIKIVVDFFLFYFQNLSLNAHIIDKYFYHFNAYEKKLHTNLKFKDLRNRGKQIFDCIDSVKSDKTSEKTFKLNKYDNTKKTIELSSDFKLVKQKYNLKKNIYYKKNQTYQTIHSEKQKISKFENSFQISTFWIIFSCGNKFKNIHSAVFTELKSRIEDKLEITSYFNCIEDIRKLKYVLLDEDCSNVFKLWEDSFFISPDYIIESKWLENDFKFYKNQKHFKRNYNAKFDSCSIINSYSKLKNSENKKRKHCVVLSNVDDNKN